MTVAISDDERDARDEREARHERLLRFVERFALVLGEMGVPRMPARVFAYVLADDGEQHTAGELAGGLRVSPAAISGAVRYLVQTGLLLRQRVPGARSDSYRVPAGDIWSQVYLGELSRLEQFEAVAAEGARLLGADSAGGRRLHETEQFMAFIRTEIPALVARWQRHRSGLLAQDGVPD